MEKCKKIRGYIIPYLNGELGRIKCSKVERHLKDCRECALEYKLQRQLEGLLKAEAAGMERELAPSLRWKQLRPLLESEVFAAKRRGRWTSTAEGWVTTLREAVLPRASRTLSETVYWGKWAALPAASLLIAVFLYHSPQTPTYAPEVTLKEASAPAHMVIRINFAPSNVPVPEGCYSDTGKLLQTYAKQQKEQYYGWRQS